MKFINIYCEDPGSFYDVRMLKKSELFQVAKQERENIFPNNTFLSEDKDFNRIAKTNGLSLLLKIMVILQLKKIM